MTSAKTASEPEATEAPKRIQDLSGQILASSRKLGTRYVDSYENAVDRALDLNVKLAETTKQDWLKGLIEAPTELTRRVTKSYTGAARTLLK